MAADKFDDTGALGRTANENLIEVANTAGHDIRKQSS
jgi:hypothetical protein